MAEPKPRMTQNAKTVAENKKATCFKDGKKRIDFVLVLNPEKTSQIHKYVKNLQLVGVEYEVAMGKITPYKFIKLHIPDKALKHFSLVYDIGVAEHGDFVFEKWEMPFSTPVSRLPRKIPGEEFTSAERIMIANKILETTKYGDDSKEYGVSKLVRLKILEDAYPLHDGPWTDETDPENTDILKTTDRHLLHTYMANMNMWYKEVPLDLIERYFGPEVGFYFAWLEYFNLMLIPPTIIGVLVFLGSAAFIAFHRVPYVEDICKASDDLLLCPVCNQNCLFAKVSEECLAAVSSFVFDNLTTAIFGIIIAFWYTLFINLWKRRECKLQMQWNLDLDEVDTDIRLEHSDKIKKRFLNEFSGDVEPYIGKMEQIGKICLTIIACTFMVLIILVAIVIIIIMKIYLGRLLAVSGSKFLILNTHIIGMVFSCFVQVMFMKVYSKVYAPFSLWLTRQENPRTQAEFDTSVLYKRFILAFANNFAPLYYIAFIKGRGFTVPHEEPFTIFERDVCYATPCIVALVTQLLFIIGVKTFLGNVITLTAPKIKKLFRKSHKPAAEIGEIGEWEKQYFLEPTKRFFLTTEFCEMIIRVGLVTFFSAAFPLSPLFALLNNLLETRSDAYKMLRFCRRPVPIKKSGIGAWNGILLGMMFLSTATNAFVIGFTNDFVPRKRYYYKHGTFEAFFNSTVTVFHPGDYNNEFRNMDQSVSECLYRGKRQHPHIPYGNELTTGFWIDMIWRLIAVFVFEHVVLLLNAILSYAIPKVPFSVKMQLTLDHQQAKDAKLKLQQQEEERELEGGKSSSTTAGRRRTTRKKPRDKDDDFRSFLIETGGVSGFV